MKVNNEPVTVDCLDKTRSFLMDMGAAIRIEESTGINVLLDIRGFAGALAAPATVVKITRELLFHEDPRITTQALVKMIGSAEVVILMEAAMRSWFHFQGKSDADYEAFKADIEARKKKLEEAQLEAEGNTPAPLASKPQIQ